MFCEDDNGGSFVTFEHSGNDIATELRDLPPGDTSATEAGWQQGFDLMVAAWSKSADEILRTEGVTYEHAKSVAWSPPP